LLPGCGLPGCMFIGKAPSIFRIWALICPVRRRIDAELTWIDWPASD
jgi:hypothetical protein